MTFIYCIVLHNKNFAFSVYFLRRRLFYSIKATTNTKPDIFFVSFLLLISFETKPACMFWKQNVERKKQNFLSFLTSKNKKTKKSCTISELLLILRFPTTLLLHHYISKVFVDLFAETVIITTHCILCLFCLLFFSSILHCIVFVLEWACVTSMLLLAFFHFFDFFYILAVVVIVVTVVTSVLCNDRTVQSAVYV